MATTSEVKIDLMDIALAIKGERTALSNAKAEFATRQTNLNNLTTKFADTIATINAYPVDGTPTQEARKEEFADLATEFIDLEADAALAIADLANRTEF